jgi:hypothetical protein
MSDEWNYQAATEDSGGLHKQIFSCIFTLCCEGTRELMSWVRRIPEANELDVEAASKVSASDQCFGRP